MNLYIRNMACEACKIVVKTEIEKMGLHAVHVELGMAEVKEKLNEKQQTHLNYAIKKAGLELVKSKNGILLDKIKAQINAFVSNPDPNSDNLSDYLIKKLLHDYRYLSSHFTSMSAGTIEQYMIALKIEKVKEMLVLEDLTLTEIAYKLHYSSVAHLSNQFKKVAGLPASHFKKLRQLRRLTIQELGDTKNKKKNI